MSLYERALKAYEQKKQNELPCNSCNGLAFIGDTPFCKIKDKLLLPSFPPKQCELKESEGLK